MAIVTADSPAAPHTTRIRVIAYIEEQSTTGTHWFGGDAEGWRVGFYCFGMDVARLRSAISAGEDVLYDSPDAFVTAIAELRAPGELDKLRDAVRLGMVGGAEDGGAA